MVTFLSQPQCVKITTCNKSLCMLLILWSAVVDYMKILLFSANNGPVYVVLLHCKWRGAFYDLLGMTSLHLNHEDTFHITRQLVHPAFNSIWELKQITHYTDIMMSVMVSQITSISIVCSTVFSSADQRNHQSSASLAFVRGIHRWPVNSSHKGRVTWKMFQFDGIIM